MTPTNVGRLISAGLAVCLVAGGAVLFFLGVPDQGVAAVAAGLAVAGGLGTAFAPGVRAPKQNPENPK